MSNVKKIFVVAGNQIEAENFIKKKVEEFNRSLVTLETPFKPSDFQYVYGPEVMRGYSDPQGYCCGTWREREDIKEIIVVILTSRRNTVVSDETIKIFEEVLRA
jgi:hypothetical protein